MTMDKVKIPENLAISDSGFLFLPNTGETFTLNETGKFIFHLLEENASTAEIKNKITEEFDIDAASAEKDLDDFIHHLSSLKLILPA